MIIKTTETTICSGWNVPFDTKIEVIQEFKKYYRGLWRSNVGTYEIKIPKKICKIVKK